MSKITITDENKKVKGVVHEDGFITDGTSRRIVGKVNVNSTENKCTDESFGGGAIIILIVILAIGFGIFKVPEIIADQYKNIKDIEGIANVISLTITLVAMAVIGIIANILSGCNLFSVYKACAWTCGICIIIDYIILDYSYSIFMMIFLVPMVSAIMAILPAIITTIVCLLIVGS